MVIAKYPMTAETTQEISPDDSARWLRPTSFSSHCLAAAIVSPAIEGLRCGLFSQSRYD